MKQQNRYLLISLLIVCGLIGVCRASGKPQPRYGPYPDIDRSRLFGVAYPASLRVLKVQHYKEDFDPEPGMALMQAMGSKMVRTWMHTTMILKDPSTPIPENVAAFREMNRLAKKYDQEIIGMNHNWFSGYEDDDTALPPRDMTEGSAYRKVLDDYQTSWQTIAGLFPEITLWELGTEWNHDPFVHPSDYISSGMKSTYTWKEKAAYVTDLLYYGTKGIRAGNPKAKVICMSPAPVYDTSAYQMITGKGGPPHEINLTLSGMAAFFILMYENIQSGHWPSTNPRDYFDALAWHPYFWNQKLGQWWVEQNHLCYQVACAYGDEGIPVYITEWGVSEAEGIIDKNQLTKEKMAELETRNAMYLEKIFQMVKEQMPYVTNLCYFRLYQDMGAYEMITQDWGGSEQVYYGLFSEPGYGHKPTKKAISFQKMAGGTGDLYQFAEKVSE